MSKEAPILMEPEDKNAKIWRYMDFTKFVSLLDKSALFFTRADKLGDPFEGSITKWWAELISEADPKSEYFKENIPSKIFKNTSEFRVFLSRCTILNCWHLNEHESAAMWRLYLQSNEGIAVQSTYQRLSKCFANNQYKIYFCLVQYIDYERQLVPITHNIDPFTYKRISFKHENELRAVIQTFKYNKDGSINYRKSKFADGAPIEVDLNILIDKIYVAPTSPKWLYTLVKSVVKKYDLDKQVFQSNLDNLPTFA